MAPLKQDLNAIVIAQLLKLFVELIERKDIVVVVPFRAVERAEFTVNIADVRVVDVPIDDVGDDLIAAPVVSGAFCQFPARVRQFAEFFQRGVVRSPARTLSAIDSSRQGATIRMELPYRENGRLSRALTERSECLTDFTG